MLNFRLENLKNKNKGRVFASPYFFILAVILTVTFGLFFLESFRSNRSDISILIIPKEESASVQADQIMENLTDITHRLSFYDRVLFDNREIQDPFSGLDKDQRKALWNKSFEIARLPGSTTLNISVFNEDKVEGNKIARQMALSLSQVASQFYNIRTELDFRIIEGPISSVIVRSWFWLVAESVLAGTALAWLVVFIFSCFPGESRYGANSYCVWKKDPKLPERDFFAPFVSEGRNQSEEDVFPIRAVKRASAPANLPIAEEEIGIPESISEPMTAISENIVEEKGEPTDEEYRERLNKLLRGEI